MFLVVFTALVGMVVVAPDVHPVVAFASLIMIAVGAGAAGCLNMWWDADIDAVMVRTRKRPIPAGKILPGEALSFGLDACGRLGPGPRRRSATGSPPASSHSRSSSTS